MKVCLLSNSDSQGGAFIAALRLHKGLHQIDVASTVIVNDNYIKF